MTVYCFRGTDCPYLTAAGTCGYTGCGCVKNRPDETCTIETSDEPKYFITQSVDISDESIEKIADAIAKKLYQQEEVEPVKHGKWTDEGAACYCSVCGRGGQSLGWKFCPWCGAKMEERKEE